MFKYILEFINKDGVLSYLRFNRGIDMTTTETADNIANMMGLSSYVWRGL